MSIKDCEVDGVEYNAIELKLFFDFLDLTEKYTHVFSVDTYASIIASFASKLAFDCIADCSLAMEFIGAGIKRGHLLSRIEKLSE